MSQIVPRRQDKGDAHLETFAGIVDVGGRGSDVEGRGAGGGGEDVEDKGAVDHFYAVEVSAAEMDFEFFFEGHGFIV